MSSGSGWRTLAEAERADHEVHDLRSQLARIERDYRSGELGAASHERLSAKVVEELSAAEAERARLTKQAATIEESGRRIDGEQEALIRLRDLRVAISRHVASARAASEANRDLGALRAAMATVFDQVHIRPADHPITRAYDGYFEDSAERVGDTAYWIEPNLREGAIVLRDAWWAGEAGQHDKRALLRQVPLHFEDRSLIAGRGVPEYPVIG